jgi:hypothetical protein
MPDADFSFLIRGGTWERRLPSGRSAQSPSGHEYGFSARRACAGISPGLLARPAPALRRAISSAEKCSMAAFRHNQ